MRHQKGRAVQSFAIGCHLVVAQIDGGECKATRCLMSCSTHWIMGQNHVLDMWAAIRAGMQQAFKIHDSLPCHRLASPTRHCRSGVSD